MRRVLYMYIMCYDYLSHKTIPLHNIKLIFYTHDFWILEADVSQCPQRLLRVRLLSGQLSDPQALVARCVSRQLTPPLRQHSLDAASASPH